MELDFPAQDVISATGQTGLSGPPSADLAACLPGDGTWPQSVPASSEVMVMGHGVWAPSLTHSARCSIGMESPVPAVR